MGFKNHHHPHSFIRLQPVEIDLISLRLTPALRAALQRLNGEKKTGRHDMPPGQSKGEETPRDDAHAVRRTGNGPAPMGRARARPMRQ